MRTGARQYYGNQRDDRCPLTMIDGRFSDTYDEETNTLTILYDPTVIG